MYGLPCTSPICLRRDRQEIFENCMGSIALDLHSQMRRFGKKFGLLLYSPPLSYFPPSFFFSSLEPPFPLLDVFELHNSSMDFIEIHGGDRCDVGVHAWCAWYDLFVGIWCRIISNLTCWDMFFVLGVVFFLLRSAFFFPMLVFVEICSLQCHFLRDISTNVLLREAPCISFF